MALTAAGRPVGILAILGAPDSEADRALLRTFANSAALALERAQLREQALREMNALLDQLWAEPLLSSDSPKGRQWRREDLYERGR